MSKNDSELNGSGPSAATEIDSETRAESPQPKKSRWGRRLLITAVVLVCLLSLLIGLAPSIASTQAVSGYALSIANNSLIGTIQLGDLSLSWGGPIEVQDLRVLDPDDREVLHVSNITCAGGLWSLITSAESFGEIIIDAPHADIHLTSDNQITLAQAFQLQKPSTDRTEGGSLPEPRGRIVVRDGAVRVSRDDQAPFEITDLDGELELQSLAEVAGKLAVTLADGGQIATELSIRGLVSGGALRIDGANGSAQIHTANDIDLRPLMAVLAPESGLAAKTSLDVDATLTDGNLTAEFATNVHDLQSGQRTTARGAQINLSLTGQLNMTPEQVTASTNLTGDAGSASADLSYQFSDQPMTISPCEVLSAILTGESIDVPDFSVEAQAQVDLAALERAMPGLLHVRPGQQITGGTLKAVSLSARGGLQPSASGAVELTGLTARGDKGSAQLEPISLAFDAQLETGKGLEIRQAELKSSFSQIVASGAASDLRASFQSDLTKLQRELGQVFELGSLELSGNLTGSIELARADNEHVGVTVEVVADRVQYTVDDRRLDLPRGNIKLAGNLALADGMATRFTATEARADLNGEIITTATGWYDLQQNAFQADLNLTRAELQFLSSRAAALGIDELARYSGTLQLQTTVARTAGQQPITSGGSLVALNLSADGQALLEGDATVSWSGVQMAADATDIRAASAQLQNSAATLKATNIRWQSGDHLVLEGKLEGAADLARCFRALGVIATMTEPPAIAGRLNINATCSTTGPMLSLVGQGGINQLEFGTGEQAVREQRLQFDYNAQLDQQNERITLAKNRITSELFSAEIAGTIDNYKTTSVLALSGSYDASWHEVTTLLHELAPATADTIIVTGRSASRFEITGPANQPNLVPTYRGVNTGLDLGWTSANLYGVPMGAAKLSPALRDGRVTLPNTKISTSGGHVNLGGVIDLQAAEPSSRSSARPPFSKTSPSPAT